MLHYPPDSVRAAETTRTGRVLLANAVLLLGFVINVGWIGFIVVLIWRWLDFSF